MTKEVMFIIMIILMAVSIFVSKEAVKSSNEINWRKMITLLSVLTLSALVITITLFQRLPF